MKGAKFRNNTEIAATSKMRYISNTMQATSKTCAAW